jgi:hypothetical protein
MNRIYPTQFAIVALVFTIIQESAAQAPLESPLIREERSLSSPPITTQMDGKIKPLFWQASIGKSALFIPLKEIEFVSVQNYKVVSSALQPGRDFVAEQSEMSRVRELTISTKSQNLIRIYYIDKLKDADNKQDENK